MARSGGGMSQSSSKHPADARARARRSALDRGVAAKPALDISGRAARGFRPFGQPQAEPAGATDGQSAPSLRGYLQWAAFVIGTRDEDCGFGAYFVGDMPGGVSRYTWTPTDQG